MTARSFLRAVALVAWKDLLLELRTKRVLTMATVFSLLVVLAFAFSFVRTGTAAEAVGRGGLWVGFLFAGTVGVTQSAAVEQRNAAVEGLMLAPVDRTSIYLGKVLSNATFVTTLAALTLAASVVFLGYPLTPQSAAPLAGVVVLASLGFAAAGVELSLLAARTDLRELFVPVVLLPVVVPVLLAGVELTRALTVGAPAGSWLQVLVAYDAVLLLTGGATFEYVLEE